MQDCFSRNCRNSFTQCCQEQTVNDLAGQQWTTPCRKYVT